MVLNQIYFLFEIIVVIESHPSIARAAAQNLPRNVEVFYGASLYFTVILTTINLDDSLLILMLLAKTCTDIFCVPTNSDYSFGNGHRICSIACTLDELEIIVDYWWGSSLPESRTTLKVVEVAGSLSVVISATAEEAHVEYSTLRSLTSREPSQLLNAIESFRRQIFLCSLFNVHGLGRRLGEQPL